MQRKFSKVELLLIRRAKLTAQITAFKEDSSNKSCLLNSFVSCIERIYSECKELNDTSYNDFYSFDEVFDSSDEPPCEHCKAVRANKKARMKLQRERGYINAQITKIGKALASEKP